MTSEAAETVAVNALAFIVADPGRLGRFLMMTGLRPRAFARTLRTQASCLVCLEHVVGWEPDLLDFAIAAPLRPEDVRAWRQRR